MKSKIIFIPILKKEALCNNASVCGLTTDTRFSQLLERGKERNVI